MPLRAFWVRSIAVQSATGSLHLEVLLVELTVHECTEWTVTKQIERAYKVRVLRKSQNGVSAIPPEPYARRFQRKMKQLFITMPMHRLDAFENDDARGKIPAHFV
ncbi:unnamed protein product [Peronospora destructor]|uniref:PIPK domain-containing protein n=1 Tax=Peronospora destructor TaxID=86335 RepID=A0AAV0VBL9_9STRA|nr:unnamed protein product [Peronospora destructor]